MPIYTFVNGSEEQKQVWREGAALMRNLPVESLGVAVEVEFVPYSELNKQTTLAETTAILGQPNSRTEVRLDYPGMGGGDGKLESMEAEAAAKGLRYNSIRNAWEVAVHELGHSVFFALPSEVRDRLARLFGASSADMDEINSPDVPWEDRIMEGIAETFKDAFLPARYRVFPNRTNRVLAYADFPAFRRLIRTITGEGTNTYCYIYGSTVNRRYDLEEKGVPLPVHLSDRDPEAFVEYQAFKGFEQGWGVQMAQFAESGNLPFTIEPLGGGAS